MITSGPWIRSMQTVVIHEWKTDQTVSLDEMRAKITEISNMACEVAHELATADKGVVTTIGAEDDRLVIRMTYAEGRPSYE